MSRRSIEDFRPGRVAEAHRPIGCQIGGGQIGCWRSPQRVCSARTFPFYKPHYVTVTRGSSSVTVKLQSQGWFQNRPRSWEGGWTIKSYSGFSVDVTKPHMPFRLGSILSHQTWRPRRAIYSPSTPRLTCDQFRGLGWIAMGHYFYSVGTMRNLIIRRSMRRSKQVPDECRGSETSEFQNGHWESPGS